MPENNTVNVKMAISGIAQVEAAIRGISGSFNNLQKAIGAVPLALSSISSALSIGVLAGLTKEAISTADEIGKMAQKAGTSTEQMSGLAYAAKLSNVSLDDLKHASKTLSEEMVNAGRGSASLFEEVLRLSDGFKALPDGAEKNALAVEHFGKAGQNLIPLLNQGSGEIRKQMQEAKTFGYVVGPQFASNAQEFNDNLTRMKTISQGVFLRLAEPILPEMNKQLERTVELFKQMNAPELAAGLGKWTATFANNRIEEWLTMGKGIKALKDDFTNGDWLEKLKLLPRLLDPASTFLEAAQRGVNQNFFDAITGGVEKLGTAFSSALTPKIKDADKALESLKAHQRLIAEALEADRRQMEALKTLSALRQGSPFLTEDEKRLNRIADLGAQANLLASKRAQLDKNSQDEKLPLDERDRSKNQSFDTTQQMTGLLGERNQLMDMGTLSGQMSSALTDLQNKFGTVQQNIARGFTDVIGTAIDSVSQNITGLIMGTETWNDALANIGRTILTSIISAIVRMFVTWIANLLILKALKAIFHTTDNTEAASSAAAWGPAAVAASIASYGTAAAVGTASAIAGMALGASVGAAISAGAGFMDGGYTGDMAVNQPAGIVHGREYVVNAEGTAKNRPLLEAINDGKDITHPVAQNHEFKIASFGDASKAKEWLESQPGNAFLLDWMNVNMWRYR